MKATFTKPELLAELNRMIMVVNGMPEATMFNVDLTGSQDKRELEPVDGWRTYEWDGTAELRVQISITQAKDKQVKV